MKWFVESLREDGVGGHHARTHDDERSDGGRRVKAPCLPSEGNGGLSWRAWRHTGKTPVYLILPNDPGLCVLI
jgi:hypothetical protein